MSLSEMIDTTSAKGKMIFHLMAVLNEFERDQLSERTKAALNQRKAMGLVYSPVPCGFRREGDRLFPVEEQQRTLDLMLEFRRQDGRR